MRQPSANNKKISLTISPEELSNLLYAKSCLEKIILIKNKYPSTTVKEAGMFIKNDQLEAAFDALNAIESLTERSDS